MRVFITGATGFIGSYLVPELLAAGHRVSGLSRSEAGAEALTRAGADVVRGDVNDLALVRTAATAADAVIHAAFNHDAVHAKESAENDRRVVEALGAVTDGKPLIVTSGTGLVRSKRGAPAAETDDHVTAAEFPRAATEDAADALIDKGGCVMVVRLAQIHDTRKQGRITWHIATAREKGRVAYVGDGRNRVPAAHVTDVAKLYRLALENGKAGARYHAVAEEGIPFRDVAVAIGERLALPVESLTADEAPAYFGAFSALAALDLPASSTLTRQALGWTPTGPTLLADIRALV